ncbi:hypothetical protein WG66_011919 [Moniliophthora roreri]|nr:hypothetical protein WG66_011919 [Moniliophthora roreri]
MSMAPFTLDGLPEELWLAVLSHLPKGDLYNLIQTNSAVYALGLQVLYRHIIISTKTLKSCLPLFMRGYNPGARFREKLHETSYLYYLIISALSTFRKRVPLLDRVPLPSVNTFDAFVSFGASIANMSLIFPRTPRNMLEKCHPPNMNLIPRSVFVSGPIRGDQRFLNIAFFLLSTFRNLEVVSFLWVDMRYQLFPLDLPNLRYLSLEGDGRKILPDFSPVTKCDLSTFTLRNYRWWRDLYDLPFESAPGPSTMAIHELAFTPSIQILELEWHPLVAEYVVKSKIGRLAALVELSLYIRGRDGKKIMKPTDSDDFVMMEGLSHILRASPALASLRIEGYLPEFSMGAPLSLQLPCLQTYIGPATLLPALDLQTLDNIMCTIPHPIDIGFLSTAFARYITLPGIIKFGVTVKVGDISELLSMLTGLMPNVEHLVILKADEDSPELHSLEPDEITLNLAELHLSAFSKLTKVHMHLIQDSDFRLRASHRVMCEESQAPDIREAWQEHIPGVRELKLMNKRFVWRRESADGRWKSCMG